ncbi:MAG: ribose-5-phosphate isomerase RpiA [Actinomycetota bacterium]
MTPDELKRLAAARAVELIEPGMRVGLGTGSTAAKLVELLGERVKAGLDVLCVPTSEATAAQARSLGIPLTTLDECPELDLTIDGADEIDPALRLIKGAGGALLWEKIVACASERMVVIADGSKEVAVLGKFPLPVEVVRFGLTATKSMITDMAEEAGCRGEIVLRLAADGRPYVTDGGNYIVDCRFGSMPDPEALDAVLKEIPGVVENGLFIGIAERAIIARPGGIAEIVAPES